MSTSPTSKIEPVLGSWAFPESLDLRRSLTDRIGFAVRASRHGVEIEGDLFGCLPIYWRAGLGRLWYGSNPLALVRSFPDSVPWQTVRIVRAGETIGFSPRGRLVKRIKRRLNVPVFPWSKWRETYVPRLYHETVVRIEELTRPGDRVLLLAEGEETLFLALLLAFRERKPALVYFGSTRDPFVEESVSFFSEHGVEFLVSPPLDEEEIGTFVEDYAKKTGGILPKELPEAATTWALLQLAENLGVPYVFSGILLAEAFGGFSDLQPVAREVAEFGDRAPALWARIKLEVLMRRGCRVQPHLLLAAGSPVSWIPFFVHERILAHALASPPMFFDKVFARVPLVHDAVRLMLGKEQVQKFWQCRKLRSERLRIASFGYRWLYGTVQARVTALLSGPRVNIY